MSWQMKLYIAVNVIAVAYCAVLAWEIVKELREGRASSRPRPGQSRALPSRPSLASLLSISRTLEVCHDGN